MNHYRQSGTTTKQMLDSLGGSIYIWPNARSINYAIDLANHLGRGDLKIYAVSDLQSASIFRGIEISGLTIDHACDLDYRKYIDVLDEIRISAKRHKKP